MTVHVGCYAEGFMLGRLAIVYEIWLMKSSCRYHPEREGNYYCQSDGCYMCEECVRCGNPQLRCKFRDSCTIHFLIREGILPEKDEKKDIDRKVEKERYE